MSSTTESTLRYGRQGGSRRVVFGHGVGGLDLYANTFIRDMVERWSKDPRLSHIEFVVPIAPTRSVGLTGGAEVPAWFDCEKEESAKSVWNVDGWKVNREHLEDSMRAYVDYATRDGGALETTVFAGFSNGGAQAIFTGLQTPCAGILVLSSVLVDDNMSIDETPKPVLLCVGDADPYVSVAAATATQKAIAESAKVEVELKVYNKMEHAACDEAIAACADWLAKVLKE